MASRFAAEIRLQLRVDRPKGRGLATPLDAPEQNSCVDVGHQIFPFLVRMRRAWVLTLLETSLLFINIRRSLSWTWLMKLMAVESLVFAKAFYIDEPGLLGYLASLIKG